MANAYVQSKSINWGAGAGTSEALTLTSNVGAGNLLWIAVSWSLGSGATISTITAGAATPTLIEAKVDSTTGALSHYYVKNAAGGSTTVTVTFSVDPGFGGLAVYEWSGADTSAPLDGHNSNVQTNPSGTDVLTSGTVSAVAGEIMVGASFNEGGSNTMSVGTGFGHYEQGSTNYMGAEDIIQGSKTSATFTTTLQFNNFITVVATFKAAGAAARGLFLNDIMSGVGCGGSFFRNPIG